MNNTIAVRAAQGIDTEDFLDHIAWKEVILPTLQKHQDILTKQLVDSTLGAPGPANSSTREQLAGKLFGIGWTIKVIETIVADGRKAQSDLARDNIAIQ